MSKYPLVIRNRVAFFVRGFMVVWLVGVALITYAALRDGPPESGHWWPFILAFFWLVGLAGVYGSFQNETSTVRIESDRSIHIDRGKPFARQQLWTDKAAFWIEKTKDSEGDPYFKLMMEAPDGPLSVREGHDRSRLEAILAEVQDALRT